MHFGGLEDDRKDYAEPHITFRSQQDSHRQCGLAICTFHLGFSLDECYALGPYTVFDGEVPRRTAWGESLNGAKYGRDGNEQEDLLGWIEEFIKDHPSLNAVDAIIAAPKSDLSTPDLAGTWAQEIGLSNR